jgi:hypothetical protein
MRRFILPTIAVCALGTAANAAVLWDQSNFDQNINAFVDQDFGDFPTYSSFMAMDVLTDAGGWEVDSVTTYYTFANGNWSDAISQGVLTIIEKTGALPPDSYDPQVDGMVVPVQTTLAGDHWEVTASGLATILDGSKEYWIGLTPTADFGVFGQEFHLAAPIVGEDTAWRNPGGGFALGTQWQTTAPLGTDWIGLYDGAFLVQGTVIPAPGALALLGLAGLAGRRRR